MRFSVSAITFFLIVLITGSVLQAIHLTVISDMKMIAESKKIEIQCLLDRGEKGIVAHSLQFSVDHQDLFLLKLYHMSPLKDYYFSTYKKYKKIFTNGIRGTLFVGSKYTDIEHFVQALQQTTLYFSCFVVTDEGSCTPASAIIVFKNSLPGTQCDNINVLEKSEDYNYLDDNALRNVHKEFSFARNLSRSFDIVEQLEKRWQKMIWWIKSIFYTSIFYWWYFLSIFLLLLLLVKYFISQGLLKSAERKILFTTAFFVASGTLFTVRNIIPLYYSMLLGSVSCLGGMIYELKSSSKKSSKYRQFKEILAIVLGAHVLPLLVIAYLLQCGM